jgi:glycosyltransferase involved in cell wall biosynthesis
MPILPRRLPKIMSYQRQPTARTVRWANRLARESLVFTGCSEYISSVGRVAGGKWEAIHNFVNVESYTFQPSVDDDAPLVFLSRIESIKGPHLAIEAARRVGRKLILAGNHSDTNDDEGCYWREQIQPHIDGDDVQYVGAVDDIEKNRLLGAAAGLIVPIQWEEPFGIVFVEALACGTPVISCARGALPEIVRNGIDGYLVDTTDETVEAIRRLPEISRQNCRSRAEEYFSSSAIVPQYTALYASLRRA